MTEGSSIEFIDSAVQAKWLQSYSQGINQEKYVRLFPYSDCFFLSMSKDGIAKIIKNWIIG